MLLTFAHPDDESFGMGGTIAKYVDDGVEVYLLCTTNGDAGTIPEAMRGQYDTIADLRLAELDCASAKLGFQDVFKLGYKDSGMMGTAANEDPECSWYVWQNNPDELTRQIVTVMRQIRPQVVVTFNEYGGYGHPDHIAVQQATVAALDKVNDATFQTGDLLPYQPQKLYYTHLPTLFIRLGIWSMRLRGKNPRKMGTNNDIDLVEILNHIEPAHTRVNISHYLDAWAEANACHASQGGGRSGIIPQWLRRLLGAKQSFTRIYPRPPHDRVDEDDLFANVTLD